jgi:hypothetical protein
MAGGSPPLDLSGLKFCSKKNFFEVLSVFGISRFFLYSLSTGVNVVVGLYFLIH